MASREGGRKGCSIQGAGPSSAAAEKVHRAANKRFLNFILRSQASFLGGGNLPNSCEARWVYYDFSQLSAHNAYKLLVSTIVPRPIAWIVSQNAQGQLNCAPFSFFNVMAGDPPTMVVGIGSREQGGPKDSLRNILETGEFVVHLVNEEMARSMNVTATPFAYGVSEVEKAGLSTAPSLQVKPPRLAASPVAFECQLIQTVPISESNTIVIARALACHIEERYLLDAEKCYVNTPELKLIGRMHGAGWYATTQELFQMDRYTVDQWESSQESSSSSG